MNVIENTLFYLLLLFVLALLGGAMKNSKQGVRPFLTISFLLLLFFFTVRDVNVGWDTIPYIDNFQDMDMFDPLHSYLEPGWLFFNKFLYSISNSPKMFFFGTGMLGLGCYFWTSRKISSDIIMSVILYYMLALWFNLMNQVRCQIAVSLCTISFYLLYKKKYTPAVLITLIAFTIHESALVFLVFIIFVGMFKELNRKTYTIIIGGVGIIFALYNALFQFVTAYYFTSYTQEAKLIRHTKGGNLKIFLIVLVFFLVVQSINYYYHRTKKRVYANRFLMPFDERLDRMLQMAVIFCLCIQLISINNTMIGRFGNYFFIYLTILIPNTIHKLRNARQRSPYVIVFYTIAFAYMMISLAFSEDGMGRDGVIPYIMNLNF